MQVQVSTKMTKLDVNESKLCGKCKQNILQSIYDIV